VNWRVGEFGGFGECGELASLTSLVNLVVWVVCLCLFWIVNDCRFKLNLGSRVFASLGIEMSTAVADAQSGYQVNWGE
jgi:hypothetical protein